MLKRTLALTLVAGAAHLMSAGAATATEPPTTAAADPAAQAQALRVVRDKATGRLRAPTDDELKAMVASERAARKARGLPELEVQTPLVVRKHAGGMRSAKLGPEYMMTLQGERQADGSIRSFHPDGTSHDQRHPVARDNRPTE